MPLFDQNRKRKRLIMAKYKFKWTKEDYVKLAVNNNLKFVLTISE